MSITYSAMVQETSQVRSLNHIFAGEFGEGHWYTFRMPEGVDDAKAVQRIWAISQDTDDPAFRPRGGWWSLSAWASSTRLLLEDGTPVGVAALSFVAGDEAAEARLALLPSHRRVHVAERLIDAVVALARVAGACALRLYVPATATWATAALVGQGFHFFRASHVMLRPAGAPRLPLRPLAGVHLRPLRAGEEAALLDALNRAWQGTWNFRPLSMEALMADLDGQRDGFLLAVDAPDENRIVGTVHALYDPDHRNPDGYPYAWVSNLTTDPAWRGRGLGRALLVAGLDYLHSRGAQSVALGVDAGSPAPVALYTSAGFAPVSTLEIWQRV